MDGGASLHLVDSQTLSKEDKKNVRRLHFPITFKTADGSITVDQFTIVYVVEFEVYAQALILKNSLPVLSL